MKATRLFWLFLFTLTISCHESQQEAPEEKPEQQTTLTSETDIVTDQNGVPIAGGANWDEEVEEQYDDELLITEEDLITDILSDIFKTKKTIIAQQVTHDAGIHDNIKLLIAPLRSQYAAIPLERCFMTQHGSLVMLAFEIFLSDGEEDYRIYLEQDVSDAHQETYQATINTNKLKLIQVVAYDLSTKTFIGKPEGFPLEQDFWEVEGLGDAMSNLHIQRLIPLINGSGCGLIYRNYLVDSPDNLIVVKPVGNTIYHSPVISIGDIGGLTGCDITVEYLDLTIENNTVTALKKTTCHCPDDNCTDFQAYEGEQNDLEILLDW